ncbi:type II secretory pathway, component ExeA (predicted ATPase) [Acidovorax sp. CF316]|uniref:ExeA family protein n=1 Tax=Acidovorax sp. CF316 TaxID=1144317 RepID=UPI00026BCA61|nr:ExeA family protein [Acidovorax sp. CF316]EJE54490.1 type II secretory pathway, component ExeA (predicted ATPase) [Acidovorax sp. CF316]
MSTSPVYATLGLSRNPFPPTPDAGSYFFTPRLEEDFAEVAHCIEARKGFVLLTGEVGLGKSTMVRRLLDTLKDKNCRSALILNTFLQDSALLSAIQSDFGLPPSDSVEQGLARLTEFLIERHQADETSLLVIDDAQNLSVQSLELVRLLCNLETGQEKLLQILLVGQPELEETLATPELRQLKSRIVKHARLSGLQKDEMPRYFDFRVNAAGAEGRLSIEPTAVDLVHRVTQGNLRQIHLVLDRCLYGLASTRGSVITEALVQRAVSDMPALGDDAATIAAAVAVVRPRRRWAWIAAGLAAGTTATVALASWGLSSSGGGASPAADSAARAPQAVAPKAESDAPAPMAAPAAQAPAVAQPVTAVAASAAAEPPFAAAASAPVPVAEVTPRMACEAQLKAAATADDVLQVQRLLQPHAANALKASPRVCRFTEGKDAWVAWLGRSEARHILAAQQATRNVQVKLKGLGLLDARELDDGFFGSKTGEALARFQQQNGLAPTGKPDDLTFFILEQHPHVSAR